MTIRIGANRLAYAKLGCSNLQHCPADAGLRAAA